MERETNTKSNGSFNLAPFQRKEGLRQAKEPVGDSYFEKFSGFLVHFMKLKYETQESFVYFLHDVFV